MNGWRCVRLSFGPGQFERGQHSRVRTVPTRAITEMQAVRSRLTRIAFALTDLAAQFSVGVGYYFATQSRNLASGGDDFPDRQLALRH